MSSPKKFAIILAGCGVYDGSEIHEATLSMLAVAQSGASYELFAPNIDQYHVINHLTGEVSPEKRNVLVESARIARGKINALDSYNCKKFDALLIPGGFGAAKNLSSFAIDGTDYSVNSEVEKAIRSTVEAKKPIGALCIAPVILSRLFDHIQLTIGNDESTAEAIRAQGNEPIPANHGETVTDVTHKIVSSPCYMLEASIDQIYQGATATVKQLIKLMD